MTEPIPAEIQIGGPIPRSLVPDLLTRIANEGIGWDYGGRIDATTPEELLEELAQYDSTTLDVGSGEANYGLFPDLEAFLVEHGIAFDRCTEAKYGYDGELVQFRPGMESPKVNLARQSGDRTFTAGDLRPIQKLLERGKAVQAKVRLDQLLDGIPDLAPLRIVDRHPLDLDVFEFTKDLPVRVRKCVRRTGSLTVGGLLQKTVAELLEQPGVGIVSVRLLQAHLATYGLALRNS